MPLILAIEPDHRQASQLKRLMKSCAGADLVLADTTELALEAIGDRIPDLVLVPALLSPQDDAALAMALRVIATAAHVQTLTIPVFASAAEPTRTTGGVLGIWRRGRSQAPATEGCDPAVFAGQIAAYLAEAEAVREALTAAAREDEEYEERKSPAAPRVMAPAVSDQSVDVEPEPESWAETEQWTYTPAAETAYVAAVDEPAAAEMEAVSRSIEPRLQPVAPPPEPLAEPDEEWEPVVSSASSGPETADALDLRSFLAELEEPHQALRPNAVIEQEPAEAIAAAIAAPIVEEAAPTSIAAFTEDSHPVPKPTELWTALSLRPHRWPRLEGVLAELPRAAHGPDAAVAEPEAVVVAEIAAAQPAEVPREAQVQSKADGARSEWLGMLDALRHDIERLRAQRTEAAGPTAGRAAPKTAPHQPPSPAPTPAPIAHVQPAAPPEPVIEEPAAALKKIRKKKDPRPVQDEWGFFDPTQCGFTALLAKLDEISDSNEETAKRSA